MFASVLVANRGEIARRVIRTLRRMGVRAVAVYSDADAGAAHVAEADEAHRIGPAPARASYLDADAILAAARASGAEAVHPGYGFLAESAAFAEACAAAGLAFVGPAPETIRAMGEKHRARRIMAAAGLAVLPGYDGDDQEPEALAAAARSLGFPLLVKPVAGGGGKGMRIVEGPEALAEALAAARREAASSFGDARVMLERFLDSPRHVEVQVFGDRRGTVVHLFERDCSIQRRHQKVIEEAPAPGLDQGLRARLGEAAARAAAAVGYVGAGTVEFLLAPDGAFYFLEMNTRLQVEHPVTEMVTGLDLVEWQLRVAAGEPLPLRQAEIRARGHAIEARLYAEDPARDFLPASGRIERLDLPGEGPNLRIDAGVRAGDAVPPDYDPLLAKLTVWEADRPRAVARLGAALAATGVSGVATNLAFLAAIAAHPAFAAGAVDTGFVARHREAVLAGPRPASERLLALAALALLGEREAAARAAARRSADPHAPWHRTDGWRLNREPSVRLLLGEGERVREVEARRQGEGYRLIVGERAFVAGRPRLEGGRLAVRLDGAVTEATIRAEGRARAVAAGEEAGRFVLVDPLAAAGGAAGAPGGLSAPLPGTVSAVLVGPGARVEAGAPLVVIEAMKMEHTVRAPAAGIVEAVHVAVGARVADGADLLSFKPG